MHKKKANKHKSRNDFSDVQRIELDTAPGLTTMELLRDSEDLEDFSKKLDQRLKLNTDGGAATNGNHHDRTDEQQPQNGGCVEEEPKSEKEEESEAAATRNQPIQAPPPPQEKLTDVPAAKCACSPEDIEYRQYESELQMPDIIRLIQRDLSEPYSIYTYRYFIHNWPQLCFLAMHGSQCVGAIVCKLGMHRQIMKRGYIAMLAVDKEYRKLKIGTNLVQKAIEAMLREQADEVVLETEITNTPALRLYENLGFVRDKRLFHYYLNGVDALRLKLWFR